jgi:UDP-N-acetylmuramate--alanine ligase
VAELDLRDPQRIHIVGIGGAGMNAIATVLAQMGHTVSGSDLRDGPGLDRLRAMDVRVHIDHDAAHVGEVDAVAISTAIPDRNVEVVEAHRRGIPVLRRAEVLAAVARTRKTIAVAGTHGKTTTSSMLALALIDAGFVPSFIIGGEVNEIGSGASWGSGEWFVVEADESDGTFLELPRAAAIVTNIEPDHLEHYGGFEQLLAAFTDFVTTTDGPCIVCADDEHASRLADATGAVTYGTSAGADYRITDLRSDRDGSTWSIEGPSGALGDFQLAVPGAHNARNAVAAVVAAVEMGADVDAVQRAIARFAGVARRFEVRGDTGGVTFVDDYAHLPTEVAAALAAAHDGRWGRVVCVFQPHRYSRTAAVASEFGGTFDRADVVGVTEIYSAGEAPRPGVSGRLVLEAIDAGDQPPRTVWLPHRDDVISWLLDELQPGDLCLTLGAGDLTSVPDEVQERLRERA